MENLEKVHFSVAVVLRYTEMQSTSIPMNFRVQGHLVTLANGHLSVVCQYFQRTSSLKLPGLSQFNFI